MTAEEIRTAQAMAWEASRDCPECKGTGVASRPFWSEVFRRPFRVDVYCRCPMGFLQAGTANPIRCELLQALPQAWDPDKTHPSWSPVPVSRAFPDLPGVGRYMRHGEQAPEVSPVPEAAKQLARAVDPSRPRVPIGPNVAELPPLSPARPAAETYTPRSGAGW